MKNIAIISIVVAPPLAGCASGSLDQGPSAEASRAQAQSRARSQARALSGIQSQLHKLKRRVGTLNQKIASQPTGSPPAVAYQAAALSDVTSRVADLEAALRANEPSKSGSNTAQDMANLTEQLSSLLQKVEQLAQKNAGSSPDNSQADQKQIGDRLAKLEARLKQLEPAQRQSVSASPSALTQRLSKLEVTQKSSTEKFDKLNGELEKDRVLVIDFLEDLDKRIAELEDASPAQPPTPATKPKTSQP